MINRVLKLVASLVSDEEIEIYTDGSAKRGRGAWAFVTLRNNLVIAESSGQARNTTSLHMEIQAALEGLKHLSTPAKVTVYSDCRVLVDAMNGPGLKPSIVSHRNLYEDLVKHGKVHTVTWKWVRAHSGQIHNERCDQLCREARGN
ncbi:MAG: ribonuclease HI [Proteobacteria bacterium]|nr:ribonuclease HI [Pseudomonadota bacterium]